MQGGSNRWMRRVAGGWEIETVIEWAEKNPENLIKFATLHPEQLAAEGELEILEKIELPGSIH